MSKRCRLRAMVVLSLGLLGLALAACGDSSPSPSPSPSSTQGVRGTTTIAGKGGEQPRPGIAVAVYAGDLDAGVVARGESDTPVVASGESDAAGAFSFDLPPGTYTVTEGSLWARPETVTVKPGQYAEVTLTIVTK